MAAWQFPLLLVPSNWVRENETSIGRFLTEDGWNLRGAWSHGPSLTLCISVIDRLLPRASSWDEELVVWGDEKSDDIQVYSDADQVEVITCRLDMRIFPNDFLSAVLQAAEALECNIFAVEGGVFMEPVASAVSDIAYRSRAGRAYAAS